MESSEYRAADSAAVPTSQDHDYDIVIAGGGMVGASLALQLSHHSNEQLRILVVESFPLPPKAAAPVYRPSFDARSTALSYGSRLILETLGLWPQLAQHVAQINSIHVSDRGHFGSASMEAADVQWPALGYVVENAWLGNILLSALREKNNITFRCPASVKTIVPRRQGVTITIEQAVAEDPQSSTISAQLVVVADGAESGLREQLGITATINDYRQTAVIANVSFRKNQQGCAYERFTDEGPMALLPLLDSEQGEPRGALVWTMSKIAAQELEDASAEQFLQQLQQRFGHRQGEFTRVGERLSFPLKLVEAQEQVRSGIVIVGNAAHSLHPVAGQGFNLALRDCARLTEVLVHAHGQQQALGALPLLQCYLDAQRYDQYKTVGFSDQVTSLFSSQQWLLSAVRGLGLGLLDVVPSAKGEFIRQAAGMHDGAAIG